jgi:neutral ceramidase
VTRTHPLLPFLDGTARRARFEVPRGPARGLPWVDGLLAGAADVDITPPPGMPKAGYSANAHDGSGFRTRLRARVLHLRAGTTSLAIVQCDLLGGSSVVQHLVAAEVADDTDVPLAGLFVGATHTHAGPGQFLGTDFYNRFASNRSGFDPAWTRFLVERIAGGVRAAVASRVPAALAFGSTEVWGFTRNRSLRPHVNNATVTDRRTEPQRPFVNVNPELQLLRVDALGGGGPTSPLAAMVVFSVHGTGISMKAHEYNADLWAYLVGELRHRITPSGSPAPVVGAIEGTHADVAPALRPGMAGHLEAKRVGRGIGAEAAALHERLGGSLRADVVLGCGLREVDLEDGAGAAIGGVTLPRRPAVGAALVAGAHENVTPIVHRIPPFRPETRKPAALQRPANPHGAKWVIGTRWLQPVVLPLRSFPRVIPFHVLRIDDTALVGLPFELTVETGRRIRAAAEAALGGAGSSEGSGDRSGVRRVVVSSVANEYSGYVATAEEYELQHYEGGHTLYGPSTERFVSAHAGELVGEVADGRAVDDGPSVRRWDLRVRRYLPVRGATSAEVGERSFEGSVRFTAPTVREDGVWETRWRDVEPAALDWHEPMVRVERSVGGGPWEPAEREGRVVDDQGWDLEVRWLGGDDGVHRYAVRWFDPAFGSDLRHRFVIAANAGRPEVTSAPFD